MEVLVRGITKQEEKLVGDCLSCKSIIEAEQSECWYNEDHNMYITYCPVCPNEMEVNMYLETSSKGQNIRVRATSIRQSTPITGANL